MSILVTGTGRCGTGSMAVYLQKCGRDIGHEIQRRHGISDWRLVVDASRFSRVVHVVRHPLPTIASWATCQPESWAHACAHAPTERSAPLLLRSMQHWFWWNHLCEAVADVRVRIEDVHHPLLCDVLGLKVVEPETPRVNSRHHSKVTAQECGAVDPVLWTRIETKARRYGYV